MVTAAPSPTTLAVVRLDDLRGRQVLGQLADAIGIAAGSHELVELGTRRARAARRHEVRIGNRRTEASHGGGGTSVILFRKALLTRSLYRRHVDCS